VIGAAGLILVALDVIIERVGNRRTVKRAARGLPPIVPSWKRRLTIGGGVAAVLVTIGLGFALLKSNTGAASTKAEQQVNVIHNVTTTSSSRTTSTTAAPGRPPAQVRVEVINASGVANAAKTKADALQALGYLNAGLANGTLRTGTIVECKPGFEKEAVTLATNVGGNATVAPFPTPAPTGSSSADCVVELGK
jgi:hypothetical protein